MLHQIYVQCTLDDEFTILFIYIKFAEVWPKSNSFIIVEITKTAFSREKKCKNILYFSLPFSSQCSLKRTWSKNKNRTGFN
jgi:hypothetical protein